MKIGQGYSPICSHTAEEIESDEDVHLPSGRGKPHLTIIRNFNAKISKKVEETSVGDHGIGIRNVRGHMLIDFKKRTKAEVDMEVTICHEE